jgi:hypothetical protein
MELHSSNNQVTGERRRSTVLVSFDNPQNDTNTIPQLSTSKNNQNMTRKSIVPSTGPKSPCVSFSITSIILIHFLFLRTRFFWSKMSSSKRVLPLAVVASIAILIGVLAVCFAARNKLSMFLFLIYTISKCL